MGWSIAMSLYAMIPKVPEWFNPVSETVRKPRYSRLRKQQVLQKQSKKCVCECVNMHYAPPNLKTTEEFKNVSLDIFRLRGSKTK